MKKIYRANIEKLTKRNTSYRKVLFTTKQMQLVVMSLFPDEEIGTEIHPKTTQFIRIEKGKGVAYINNKTYHLKDGVCIMIPAGTKHNIINTGKSKLKIYTLYSPPEHDEHARELRKLIQT
jgi:mannose-6-phosphate isomerase-like protein (cupin superfamily)